MGDVMTKEWYFDSGATSHMARSDQKFADEVPMNHGVGTANSSSMMAVAKGSVLLDTSEGEVNVGEVLKIPELATNLLSVSAICKRGNKVVFTADKCEVWSMDGELVVTGVEDGGLYRLDRPERSFLVNKMELWHKRLGRLNVGSLRKLKKMADGVEFQDGELPDCIPCLEGKQTRQPFSCSRSRATELLELVHSDLCGPMEVSSLGGSRYFMTFLDDASRRVKVYFLERKSQALDAFKKFKALAERQTGKKLRILRTDNGREYVNADFRKVLEQFGIRHQTTCPYTPEQNGASERFNRSAVEKARCMLNEAKLGKQFWAEAISTAAYLMNRCPTRALGEMVPEEAWTGRKPNLKHLKVFGSEVMIHIPKVRRHKFDPKSRKGIFVGYCEDTKGYRVYNPETNEFLISQDVIVIGEGVSRSNGTCELAKKPIEFMKLQFGPD